MKKIKAFCNNVDNSAFARGLVFIYQHALFISGVVILLGMVITIVFRGLLGINMFGTDELILAVVFWFYFLGAVNGSREDSQIRADLTTVLIKSPRAKRNLRLVTRFIELAGQVFLFVLSCQLWRQNMRLMPRTTGLRIPFLVPQTAIVVGFLLMFFYNLMHWLRELSSTPEELEKSAEGGDQ